MTAEKNITLVALADVKCDQVDVCPVKSVCGRIKIQQPISQMENVTQPEIDQKKNDLKARVMDDWAQQEERDCTLPQNPRQGLPIAVQKYPGTLTITEILFTRS